jgi:DNA-directed RNA polymerase subunit E'/Rpb7
MLNNEEENQNGTQLPIKTVNHKSTYIDTPDSSDGSIPPPPPLPASNDSKNESINNKQTKLFYKKQTKIAHDDYKYDFVKSAAVQSQEDEIDINILDELENAEQAKKKQLELLKQTYVDLAKRKINRQKNIFSKLIDVEKIIVNANTIDKNIDDRLITKLKHRLENKCNKHGLIKEDSISILSISSAILSGHKAEFHVTYQALACNPVEGMIVESTIINITKAGVRAELQNFKTSPLIIFIARDHHNNSHYFNNVKEGDSINVKIIGVRFELNDSFVSVIGEIYNI